MSSDNGGVDTFQCGPSGISPGPVLQDAPSIVAPAWSSQLVGFSRVLSFLKLERVGFVV